MSDDTPTQRFDATGDDALTQRLETPQEVVSPEVAEERKSRKLIIILASIGGALLLAVLIVLIVLLTKSDGTPAVLPTPSASGSSTPTSTPTPTVTPTATAAPTPTQTPTTAPPPPSTDASVDSFTVSTTTVDCTSASTVPITLTWATSNATKVSFGIDTDDASAGAFFSDIAPSGDSDTDFPPGYSPFTYTCGNGQHRYVITAINSGNGTKDTVILVVTG